MAIKSVLCICLNRTRTLKYAWAVPKGIRSNIIRCAAEGGVRREDVGGRRDKVGGTKDEGEGRRDEGEGRKDKGEGRRDEGEGRRDEGGGARDEGPRNLPIYSKNHS